MPVCESKRKSKLGDRARRDYVRKCDREFMYCVSECANNVIKGNVSLKKTSLRKKHRIVQNGGFLTGLIPPVLSALVALFSK